MTAQRRPARQATASETGKLQAAHRCAGFSMLEVMVTVAILIIGITLAIPSFTSTREENRASSQTNALVGAFRLARSEAVRRGTPVTVCRTNAARDACAGSDGDWQPGWLVVDNDNNIIRDMPALVGGNTLTGSTGLSSAVVFNALGEPTTAGSFKLCESQRSGYARQIHLNAIGRVHVDRYDGNASGC